ncbi:hypothetical protein PMAYCL1PPCAC_05641 [Pristionchus mayeri]|uniref:Uncharacterized protein n=1 Tax=Pristionchus mayeri TaxID=1317129 RepID=A0AAN4Z787_9BILA|nr:hypothetical protein PMAYCL1PPCAC_05641 [Pristionchus mayeri]
MQSRPIFGISLSLLVSAHNCVKLVHSYILLHHRIEEDDSSKHDCRDDDAEYSEHPHDILNLTATAEGVICISQLSSARETLKGRCAQI